MTWTKEAAVITSEAGQAQAGTASSITLRAGAPSDPRRLIGRTIALSDGRSGIIATYDGDTKVATLEEKLPAQFLYNPGIAGNYASTPDSAALSVGSNLSLAARVYLPEYTPPNFALDFVGDPAAAAARIAAIGSISGGANGTRVNSSGLIESASAPRIDYDPATREARGLLIEEARTNLCLQSEDFSNASWTKNNTTITANAVTSPDGNVTADAIVDTAANVAHEVTESVAKAASATAYTVSVWGKFGTQSLLYLEGANGASGAGARAQFNLQTGVVSGAGSTFGAGFAVGTASIVAYPNGWYRCILPFTSDADTTIKITVRGTNGAYLGTGAVMFYLWGAQLEAAASVSSYIPTTTAAVTRSADGAVITDISGFFNATEGTIVAEYYLDRLPASSLEGRLYNIDDGTANERFSVLVLNTGSIQSIVTDGGVAQATLNTIDVYTAGSVGRAALAYKANDFAAVFNGGTLATDSSGTLPTVSQLALGRYPAAGAYLNGHIRRLAYYNKRLTNNEDIALSK